MEVECDRKGGVVTSWRFEELPARPMIELKVNSQKTVEAMRATLRTELHALPHDAIVRVRVQGSFGANSPW